MYIKIQVYVGHLKFNQINNRFNIKRRLKWLLINFDSFFFFNKLHLGFVEKKKLHWVLINKNKTFFTYFELDLLIK